MEHSLAITGFYGGILALLYIALSLKVIGIRRRLKIGLGDGGDKELNKAIRIHGNFVEYIPFSLLLLAILEMNNGSQFVLHALGGALVTCRFLHAMGIAKSSGTSWQRFVGILGTFLAMLILAAMNIAVMLF